MKSFIEILQEWKEDHWVMFASKNTRMFWCNLNGRYRITAPPNRKIIREGANIKRACEFWEDIH